MQGDEVSKLEAFSLSRTMERTTSTADGETFVYPRFDAIDRVVPNLRDIAVASEISEMAPGMLYRAARPFSRSLNDIYDVYVKTLRIQTIIDLRDDDLSAIPEELEARLLLCRFFRPYSVTASRPKPNAATPPGVPPDIHPPRVSSDTETRRTRDNGRNHNHTRSTHEGRSHEGRSHEGRSHEGRSLPTQKSTPDLKNYICRENIEMKIRNVRPELDSEIVRDLATDPNIRPIRDIVLNNKRREKKLMIVNIFDAPMIKKRVMETVSSSPYLPMLVLAKMTDKLTGTALAPFYFCKYIMSAHELYDSYVEMLKTTGENFSIALKLIALSDGPILYHCSLGKDRTGILSMLILWILGAQPSGIIFDYSLSEMSSNEAYREYIDKFVITYSGLSRDFCGAGVDTMGRTLDFLKTEYGGVDMYLDSIKFTKTWRSLMRHRFLTHGVHPPNI